MTDRGWYTSNEPSKNSKEVGLFEVDKDSKVPGWSIDSVLRGLNQFGGMVLFLLAFYTGTFIGEYETATYYMAMAIFLMGIGGGFR